MLANNAVSYTGTKNRARARARTRKDIANYHSITSTSTITIF